MYTLDFTQVETQINRDAGRIVNLSAASVVLALAALYGLEYRHNWSDSGEELSDSDYDDVQNWVSTAVSELITAYSCPGGGAMAIGSIVPMAVDTLPDNMAWCDGTEYDREDYPDLYAVLDDAFIIDADTFEVPDLDEQFIYGTQTPADVGDTGGSETHTLTKAELPEHTHNIQVEAASGGNTAWLGRGGAGSLVNVTSSAVGDGDAHNNLPPYIKLRHAIVMED